MIKLIRVLSVAIMLAAGVTSYHTQLEVFLSWRLDTLTATIAPVSIDALAVICSVAMHLPTITRAGRVTAILVLVVAGGGSGVANWMAGLTLGAKAVHVGMVVCYLLAETVASQVREREAAATADVAPAVQGQPVEQTTATEPEAVKVPGQGLPESPVSPAIAGPVEAFVQKHGHGPSVRHERRLVRRK